MLRLILFIFMALMLNVASAQEQTTTKFKCYAVFHKGACWKDYNVTYKIHSVRNPKRMAEHTVPKDKMSAEIEFPCRPSEKINIEVKYSPVVWEDDKDKIFETTTNWYIPAEISVKERGYYVDVCFPKDFKGAPIPLTPNTNCACDIKNNNG